MSDVIEQHGESYDVAVIGGGINGAGIAFDAAARGLRVLLLEASDFGGATSAWCTRLIHGGLRYLEYAEIGLVRESLHERRRLLQNAPHLVAPVRITIPIYKGAKRGRALIKLGMLAYDILSMGKSLPPHRMLSAQRLRSEEPGIDADGLTGGAQYFDAQITYPERLVVELVLAATQNGADVRNHSPLTGFRSDGDAYHLTYDTPSGQTESARARFVVNAAGPWVDRVLALGEQPQTRLMEEPKGAISLLGNLRVRLSMRFTLRRRAMGARFSLFPGMVST